MVRLIVCGILAALYFTYATVLTSHCAEVFDPAAELKFVDGEIQVSSESNLLSGSVSESNPGTYSSSDELTFLPQASFAPVINDYSWQYYPAINLSGYTPRLHKLSDSSSLIYSGWIDFGATLNPSSPKNRSNGTVLFNDRANNVQLNQVYQSIARPISHEFDEWEMGWQADMVLGTDSRFVRVPGLEKHHNRKQKWNSDQSDYGIALPQAYAQLGIPWANGLDLKFGHFYSTSGFERFPSAQNLLYSHSYAFAFGAPFTYTGIVGNYQMHPRVHLQLGYTTGWDNFSSGNDQSAVIAGVRLGNEHDRQQLGLSITTGREFSNLIVGGTPIVAPRTYGNLVYAIRLNDSIRFAAELQGGHQEKGRLVGFRNLKRGVYGDARWWGSSQYLITQYSESLLGILRFEQFFDLDQNRIGIPIVYHPDGKFHDGNSYFATTVGANWAIHPRAMLRPELRFDWSDVKENPLVVGNNSPFRTFVDHTRSSQFTLACDVLVHF